jgi:hypothetical protein
MADYWINPNHSAVGAIAISDREMSILYQLGDIGKQAFEDAMTEGISLRDAMVGPGEILYLHDLTSVSLSPWTCCLYLEFVEKGQPGRHCLYVWDRATYDQVVEALRHRLGPRWELRKGTENGARLWSSTWPILALVLLFTVIGFFAVRQWETGEAARFEGRRGAAGRAFAAAVGQSMSSKGWLMTGIGLMTLHAAWLIYRTTVPSQEQLLPVEESNIDSYKSRYGSDN